MTSAGAASPMLYDVTSRGTDAAAIVAGLGVQRVLRQEPHERLTRAGARTGGFWLSVAGTTGGLAGMLQELVDEKGRRIINLAIACFLGGVGLLLPIISGSLLLAVIGFSLALVGVTAARAIFWTIPTRFLTGVAAAGGLAFINSIASRTPSGTGIFIAVRPQPGARGTDDRVFDLYKEIARIGAQR